jgi:Protein of unknown function (DUF2878)
MSAEPHQRKIPNLVTRNLTGFVTFNIGWWACALGASYGHHWIGPTLLPIWMLLHARIMPNPKGETLFLVMLGVIGFAVDSALIQAGLFRLTPEPSPWAPLWLVSMWILFGITFESTLLLRRRLALLLVLGAISGPISYFAGEALKVLEYARPLWLSLLLHGLIWAITYPLLFHLRDICLRWGHNTKT